MKELVARDVRHLVAKLAERFRGRVICWLLTPLWEGPSIAKCQVLPTNVRHIIHALDRCRE